MTLSENSRTSGHDSAMLISLFEWILAEFGRSERFTEHLLRYQGGKVSLAETAKSLALEFDTLRMPVDQALAHAGPQSPMLTRLPTGGWLIAAGFKKGRVHAVLIDSEQQQHQYLSMAALKALLGDDTDGERDWYLVEDRSPMHANSHGGHHLPPLTRLWSIVKMESEDIWRVFWLAVASGLLSLATPAAVQSLVNTVALGGMFQPLVILSLLLFIFLSFFSVVSILQSYIVELLQRRVFVRMSAEMAFRLPQAAWQPGNSHDHVELVNRFFDILTVQKAGKMLLLEGLSTSLQAGIGLLILAFYHPLLLLFDFVILIWLLVVAFWLGRGGIKTAIEESHCKYALVAWLETLAGKQQSVKFNQVPEFARQRANQLTHGYLNARQRHYRVLLRQQIGLYALYVTASTSVLVIGGWLVMQGQLSLGQLVAAELIVSGVLLAFAKFKKQLESFYDLVAGVDKLGYLLDLPEESTQGEAPDRGDQGMTLTVSDVAFAFPDQQPLFKNLSFDLSAGERLAIKLPRAQGKSVLTSLLTGLYQPQHGSIKADGRPLYQLEMESWREQIGLVSRHEFFPVNLLENIRLGRDWINVQSVREILDQLGLLKDLQPLSDHPLQLEPDSHGAPLTYRQQKKVLLARALIGQPRLLIIDSAFDHWPDFIDSAGRRLVFAESAPWSVIVLTESDAVARCCDRVIELEHADA